MSNEDNRGGIGDTGVGQKGQGTKETCELNNSKKNSHSKGRIGNTGDREEEQVGQEGTHR